MNMCHILSRSQQIPGYLFHVRISINIMDAFRFWYVMNFAVKRKNCDENPYIGTKIELLKKVFLFL